MRKIILSSFLSLGTLLILVSTASAQNSNYAIPNPSRYDSLEDLISAAASLIRPVFLVTFGAMIIFGAFMLLTSSGDEEKIQTSRKTIIAAIVGFVIAVFAPTIVNFALSLVGVEGFN